MQNKKYYITISIIFYSLLCFLANAQESDISLNIGEKTITLNDPFVVTVTVKYSGEAQVPACKFPDLPNFTKKGFSRSITHSFVNGQAVSTCNIMQNYAPQKIGSFKISSFKVNVNELNLKAENFTIKVNKPLFGVSNSDKKDNKTNEEDFTDFIEGNSEEIKNIKNDAFLTLSTNKTNPFVGEGFTVTLAFYVADNNATEMEFDHNEIQIPQITKQLKPENCWEESFGLTETQQGQVLLNGKPYTQFKFYQATFYPLNNKPIVFPSVGLKIKKYVIGKNGEKIPQYTTFRTRTFVIKTKDLPNHPLKQEVSVGEFALKEVINKSTITTGKSVQYRIQITGDGYNIKLPEMKNDSLFDFFPPEVEANTYPQNGKVVGTKTFSFLIIPKQAGNFALDKYFKWVYFNTKTARYDTLSSKLNLKVSGETIKTSDTPPSIVSVYDGLKDKDSSEAPNNFGKLLKDEANILLAIMLMGMFFILLPIKKRK
ncbi:BatD family protein [Arcicella rigui]|uniref:BatD family protein n=1 Tax=Arcicella rigui TaxID=797020 RepID=A0ABU5Q516_9BACT|nr:BatD family protein [Arcicella rigui]MEA5137529.1 BatD family protein [Arcicella rigui]